MRSANRWRFVFPDDRAPARPVAKEPCPMSSMLNSSTTSRVLRAVCGVAIAASFVVGPASLCYGQYDANKAAKDAANDAKDAAKKAVDSAKEAGKKAVDDATKAVKDAAGAPEMSPEEAKMMERWIAYSTPGEAHAEMAHHVGEWNIAAKFYMEPGAPPVEGVMKATGKLAMDGRFIIEKVTGNVDFGAGPQPFEGMAITGYDNHKKQYFSSWIDNMGTGMMMQTGTVSGKVMTLEGKAYDPMIDAEKSFRSTTKIIDDNTHVMEMWNTGPDGTMVKNMELTYTRVK